MCRHSHMREKRRKPNPSDVSIPELAAPPLRVGAFNIQIFGKKKMKNKNVTSIITKAYESCSTKISCPRDPFQDDLLTATVILQRYDLVLIQEIRDRGNTSLDNLLAHLNDVDPEDPFDVRVSERLGRSQSKEQYAFFFRPSKMTVVDTYQYDDGVDDGTDAFEREPYAIRIRCPDLVAEDFAVIAIHTSPSKAVAEINALLNVWEVTKRHWGMENIIIAGDFNADGDFVTGRDWEKIAMRSDRRFSWVIQDNVDTTVGSTDCSYDRFVVTGKQLKGSLVPGSAQVFKFDSEFGLSSEVAKDVSDHYPIELCMEGKQNKKLQKVLNTELSVVIQQVHDIPSVSHVRALYRSSKTRLCGFTTHVKRGGVRKSMLEVIAVKENITNVVDNLLDFHKSFPEVLARESVSMAKAYLNSGIFDKPPYVYGLCTMEARKSFDITITCRLREPLTCNIAVKKRRS